MSGTEKHPLLVIGRSAKPRCFKNVRSLPVIYKSNKKAWMNSKIFEQYLLDWDKRLQMENRKILLFVDNCPAHPNIQQKLKNIKLEFFPPNMTSQLQPMDRGIIRSFKNFYRQILVRRRIIEIEENRPAIVISVLDALNIMVEAWARVKQSTIVNCFKSAGFNFRDDDEDMIPLAELIRRMRNQEAEIEDADDVEMFDQINGTTFESFEDYIRIDDNVVTGDFMTDDDIIESTQASVDSEESSTTNSEDNMSSNSDSGVNPPVTKSAASEALEIIHRAFMQSEKISPKSYLDFYNVKNALMSSLNY